MSVDGSVRVVVAWQGKSVAFSAQPGRAVTIGRDADCDVVVPIATVSRQHVRLQHERGRWTVTDLGSTAGTRRQGSPIRAKEAVPLMHGDQLDFGAGVMAAVEIERFGAPASVGAADDAAPIAEVKAVPQASTDGLLAHVLAASRAIGQAATEDDKIGRAHV